ncbi:MAG: hypothetical protein ABSF92_08195 [Candidatus Acidiferrales bacterium]|jgi:hypothetical protein
MLSPYQTSSQNRSRWRSILRGALFALSFYLTLGFAPASAQEARPGPLTPPPGHDVRRLSTSPTPEAPPPVPPEQIIRRFAAKEDEFLAARAHFGFRKMIRIEEFGQDGKLSGEFQLTTVPGVASDGKPYEKIVDQKPSTLHYLRLEPEDALALGQIPLYPLTSAQLGNYNLTYEGKEQIDEVNCYIFHVKPKAVERARAFFEGLVWVDDQDLQVVRTYGKWVTDLGDYHSPQLPFTLFDSYRENTQGKFWFPAYVRSEDSLYLKDREVRVRLIVRWQDYKPLLGAASAAVTPVTPASAAAPSQTHQDLPH